jgi:hypothetical protein
MVRSKKSLNFYQTEEDIWVNIDIINQHKICKEYNSMTNLYIVQFIYNIQKVLNIWLFLFFRF